MTKLRARFTADGRVGWPDVVQYEICERRDRWTGQPVTLAEWRKLSTVQVHKHFDIRPTGELLAVPPIDGRPFLLRVRDPGVYAELEARGWLSSTAHLGPREPVANNRK